MEAGFSVALDDLTALGAALAAAGDEVDGARTLLSGLGPDAGASTDELAAAIGAVAEALLRSASALHDKSAEVRACLSTYESAEASASWSVEQAG